MRDEDSDISQSSYDDESLSSDNGSSSQDNKNSEVADRQSSPSLAGSAIRQFLVKQQHSQHSSSSTTSSRKIIVGQLFGVEFIITQMITVIAQQRSREMLSLKQHQPDDVDLSTLLPLDVTV
jgi:hypothetical protein